MTDMMRAIGVGLILVTQTGAASGIDITACGVTIPAHGKGVLTADVQCEGRCAADPSIICDPNDEATCPDQGSCIRRHITLGRGARLDLGGHVLRHTYQGTAVVCGGPGERGRCTIVGPGSIIGGKGTGISAGAMDVEVRDLTIDNTDTAVMTGGWVFLRDVELGTRDELIRGGGGVRAVGGIVGPAGLLSGGDLIAVGAGFRNVGSLIAAGTVHLRDLTLRPNAYVAGLDVSLRRVTSEVDGFTSVVTSRIVADRHLRLQHSSAGTIQSGRRPRLSADATCERSSVAGSAATWGVCASD